MKSNFIISSGYLLGLLLGVYIQLGMAQPFVPRGGIFVKDHSIHWNSLIHARRKVNIELSEIYCFSLDGKPIDPFFLDKLAQVDQLATLEIECWRWEIPTTNWDRKAHLRKVVLKNVEFETFPFFLLQAPRLRYLDLTSAHILEKDSFDIPDLTTESLRYLRISDCGLSYLKETDAWGRNLETLALDGNRFEGVPIPNECLENLKCLNMSRNPGLHVFPAGFQAPGLQALSILDATEIMIHDLETKFRNLQSLRIQAESVIEFQGKPMNRLNIKLLDLRAPVIAGLDALAINHRKLESINLESRYLDSTDWDFGEMRRLRKLTLSLPMLSQLPDGIHRINRLEELFIESDSLNHSELFGSIDELKRLKLIQVRSKNPGNLSWKSPPNNSVLRIKLDFPILNGDSIFSELRHFSNLKSLELTAKCGILHVPDNISGLTNLEHLDVADVVELSPEVGKLKNLKTLNVGPFLKNKWVLEELKKVNPNLKINQYGLF